MLRAGSLPAPLHFTGSFLEASLAEPCRQDSRSRGGLLAIRRNETAEDLDRITMLDWLREKHQPEAAIRRFWNQVLVSAVNEDLDRMAASHGFQVFWLGFLARANSYEMGVPAVPLGDLYGPDAWKRVGNVSLHLRAPVDRVDHRGWRGARHSVQGEQHAADYYVSALPFERVAAVMPELDLDLDGFEHSPITGIHLWFDRSITQLPHATLLDRTYAMDVQQIRRAISCNWWSAPRGAWWR